MHQLDDDASQGFPRFDALYVGPPDPKTGSRWFVRFHPDGVVVSAAVDSDSPDVVAGWLHEGNFNVGRGSWTAGPDELSFDVQDLYGGPHWDGTASRGSGADLQMHWNGSNGVEYEAAFRCAPV